MDLVNEYVKDDASKSSISVPRVYIQSTNSSGVNAGSASGAPASWYFVDTLFALCWYPFELLLYSVGI